MKMEEFNSSLSLGGDLSTTENNKCNVRQLSNEENNSNHVKNNTNSDMNISDNCNLLKNCESSNLESENNSAIDNCSADTAGENIKKSSSLEEKNNPKHRNQSEKNDSDMETSGVGEKSSVPLSQIATDHKTDVEVQPEKKSQDNFIIDKKSVDGNLVIKSDSSISAPVLGNIEKDDKVENSDNISENSSKLKQINSENKNGYFETVTGNSIKFEGDSPEVCSKKADSVEQPITDQIRKSEFQGDKISDCSEETVKSDDLKIKDTCMEFEECNSSKDGREILPTKNMAVEIPMEVDPSDHDMDEDNSNGIQFKICGSPTIATEDSQDSISKSDSNEADVNEIDSNKDTDDEDRSSLKSTPAASDSSNDVWSGDSVSSSGLPPTINRSSNDQKVKYSFRNRCEKEKDSERWKRSLCNTNRKHDFDYDDLFEAIQDVAERGFKIRKAAKLRNVPYYRVYAFIKDMLSICASDDDRCFENDDKNLLRNSSTENSRLSPDGSDKSHTILEVKHKTMPSAAISPMINIPAGVVEEFLTEKKDKKVLTENKKELTSMDITSDSSQSIVMPPLDTTLVSKPNLAIPVSTESLPSPKSDLLELSPHNANVENGSDDRKVQTSIKRSVDPDEENEKENKRIKLNEEINEKTDEFKEKVILENTKKVFNQEDIEKEVKKIKCITRKLHKLPRKDLEKVITELFMNKILHDHELGQYKTLVEKLENNLEVSRKKAKQFHKELDDMRKVTKRLQDEHTTRKEQIVTPIKIKRSVGIQASPQIILKGSGVAVPAIGSNTAIPNTQRLLSPRNSCAISTNSITHAPATPNNTAQTTIINKQMVLLNTSGRQLVQYQQNKPNLYNALLTNKTTGINVQNNAVKSAGNQGVIDLTDEEENKSNTTINKSQVSNASSIVSQTVSAGVNPAGLVLPPAAPQTQYVILPNGSVSGAAVMVANVPSANASTIQGSNTTPTQTRLVAISSAPTTNVLQTSASQMKIMPKITSHPAPLPRTAPQQVVGSAKQLPSTPTLKLSHKDNSIVLSWTMNKTPDTETIASYQLYAYQESNAPPSPLLWKKVGSVKALELPMACTLTQFMPGHRYHFAVRAVDAKSRLGPFSDPKSINLEK